MRVLAATFMDRESAEAAKVGLIDALAPGAHEFRLGELGQASDPAGPASILAGRFEDDVIAVARDVVEQFGGTIVVDMDEGRAGN